MKAKKMIINMTGMLSLVFLTLSFNGCTKDDTSVSTLTTDDAAKAELIDYTITDLFDATALALIDSLPSDSINQAELDVLTYMREEELLAHDVYLALSQLYTKPIFANITKSEAVHTEAIKALLDKYQLADPAINHVAGVFNNPDLQSLYTLLVSKGSASLIEGLIVGATIEDLDISDLKTRLIGIDNADIILVLENLERGSRNHMRSFYANILFYLGTYTPQYISQEEFDSIVTATYETGAATGICIWN
ncbi:MAG: DUF2202 domain-containing protein [Bacteroidales bacterium]|nr:DUF2202 domain-containing protein [Bacteroidales bacterium]